MRLPRIQLIGNKQPHRLSAKRKRRANGSGPRLRHEKLEQRQLLAGDFGLSQSYFPDAIGPQSDAQFGDVVAVNAQYRVVSATAANIDGRNSVGEVYVYNNDAAGELVATLRNPGSSGDSFGQSLAIDGTTVAVGASLNSVDASNSGVVYLYDLADGSTPSPATIVNPTPSAGDVFGENIAMQNGVLAVSSRLDDTVGANSGAVYLYNLSDGDTSVDATVTNPGSLRFGSSIDLDNDVLAIGSPLDGLDPDQPFGQQDVGAAFVYSTAQFRFDGSSPSLVGTLRHPDADPEDEIGQKTGGLVRLSEGRLFLNATSVPSNAPASVVLNVYALTEITAASPGNGLLGTLANPAGNTSSNGFLSDVAVSGNRVLIGADGDDTSATNTGAAYLFTLSETNSSNFIESTVKIDNPDPRRNDLFGDSLAIDGDSILIGSPATSASSSDFATGRAFTFDVVGGNVQPGSSVANATPATDDAYGTSIEMNGQWMVIGVPGESNDLQASGAVEVYDVSGPTPVLVERLKSPSPVLGGVFGTSMDLDGDRLAVGQLSSEQSTAFVFELSNAGATLLANLDSPDGISNGYGRSVAMSGDRVLVGDSQKGNASLFDIGNPEPILIDILADPDDGSNLFGWTAAMDGDLITIGAFRGDTDTADFAGKTHVYRVVNDDAALIQTLTSPDPSVANGYSSGLSVQGNTIVVGEPGRDLDPTATNDNTGSVYVYEVVGNQVSLRQSIEQIESSYFGQSVDLHDGQLAIGAVFDRHTGVSGGRAYMYDLVDGEFVATADFDNPTGLVGSDFGSAIATWGNRLLVASPGDSTIGSDQGAAHLFEAIDPQLTLTRIDGDSAIDETDGVARYQLERNVHLDTQVTVNIQVEESTVLESDNNLSFSPGQTSLIFELRAIENEIRETETDWGFSIEVDGYVSLSSSIEVVDNEPELQPLLSISPNAISELDGTATATVQLNALSRTDYDVTIRATAELAGHVSMPATVHISALESSVTFDIDAIDNDLLDGDKTGLIELLAQDAVAASKELTILDNEVPPPNQAPTIETLEGPTLDSPTTVGETFTLSGSFADTNLDDSHSVLIQWGDGTSTSLTGDQIDQIGDTFAIDHQYGVAGFYDVLVTVDDGTASTTATLQAVVVGISLRDDGTLIVVGTDDYDQIRLKRKGPKLEIQASFAGGPTIKQSFAWSSVNVVHVFSNGGGDKINVDRKIRQSVIVFD
ncbi:hypothetical protein [Aporhodopirellula aestuarii]|uniref:PKD domain-containing protein n=1 Tax=Aporhodopirellula aestuarii TaxID=2950107 RepID=A0ABT0UD36_9BACT|nr:hypothetical protein [Aporhodopirellula aestuarii]MCM2374944.1 hypothetical protein [Aporhodopirellula aestuarii]